MAPREASRGLLENDITPIPVFLVRNADDRLAVEHFFHAARRRQRPEKKFRFIRYDQDFRRNRRN